MRNVIRNANIFGMRNTLLYATELSSPSWNISESVLESSVDERLALLVFLLDLFFFLRVVDRDTHVTSSLAWSRDRGVLLFRRRRWVESVFDFIG